MIIKNFFFLVHPNDVYLSQVAQENWPPDLGVSALPGDFAGFLAGWGVAVWPPFFESDTINN